MSTQEALKFTGWKTRNPLYNYRNSIRSVKVRGYRQVHWSKPDLENLIRQDFEKSSSDNKANM